MNIIFAGKNNIAIKITEHIAINYPGYHLYAILNQNDKGVDGFQRSYKKYCEEKSINIIDLDAAYKLENSIFISLEFDKIIDPLKFNHNRIYNIHFSLLPKYKGMYTSAWPIINNEEKTGVTFHKIDHGIDTGDIIYQAEIDIESDETAKTLYEKYIETGARIIIDNIKNILTGNYILTSQDIINASYYSKKSIDYSKISIDLNKCAIEIKKQLDAFTFREYQIPEINQYKIFGCEIQNSKSIEKPGKVIRENEKSLFISTVDYDLCLYKDVFFEFLSACKNGDLKYIRKYINPYLINEKNNLGWSPIIVSVYNGRYDIVNELLKNGANINDTNYKGTTVFMYAKDYAIKHNDIEFLSKLIKLGADVNLKDLNDKTVFDYLDCTNCTTSRMIMEKFK